MIEELKVACLRLPCFPLQWLYRRRPELRGRRLAWLQQLKPDAPLRYLSTQAKRSGLQIGMRYASALGLAPDLVAGSCDSQALARMEAELIRELSCFSPRIFRARGNLESGFYLLDIQGLSLAFAGMENWARQLLGRLSEKGWRAALAMGFTSFGCEIATYSLSSKRPWTKFCSRESEQQLAMQTPMASFDISPEGIKRLSRFKIKRLDQFLALEVEDVSRRLGADALELYYRASDALFHEPELLVEREPCWDRQNFLVPTHSLDAVMQKALQMVRNLLPRLIERSEGVSELYLWLITEAGHRLQQRIGLNTATTDLCLLEELLRLRLQHSFQSSCLNSKQMIEQLAMVIIGEPKLEEQNELFVGWEFSGAERPARDRKKAMWILSCLRAKFGDSCLRIVCFIDHNLPGRNFSWKPCLERQLERGCVQTRLSAKPSSDLQGSKSVRVRRYLANPMPLPSKQRLSCAEGPFLYEGGWWEQEPFTRSYFYARQAGGVSWLYFDHLKECWYLQGWLQ